MRLIFRPQFWIDLEDGVVYLAERASPEIASRWHDEVMAQVKQVESRPDLGRLRRDLVPPGIRSVITAICCFTAGAKKQWKS